MASVARIFMQAALCRERSHLPQTLRSARTLTWLRDGLESRAGQLTTAGWSE